jgi:hypothetical protein
MSQSATQRSSQDSESQEKSPTEKLEDKQPVASPVPGAENPESEAIKAEINPNTE